MKKLFEIDKESQTPVYRQIIERITSLVQQGKLQSGDKLPTERELANLLQISRGTITRAYLELEKNQLIDSAPGRGSYISQIQDIRSESRKDIAVRIIHELIYKLEKMKFSHKEILTLIHLIVMEREQKIGDIHIAAIDCNPESLTIFEKQLTYQSPVKIYKYLLDDIVDQTNRKKTFEEYDLILCTSTHYTEIAGLLPELKEKIIKVAVSLSQQTIIDLAKISPSQRIGIVCESDKFYQIIKQRLKGFQINLSKIKLHKKNHPFDSFFNEIDILILPPEIKIEYDKDFNNYLQLFQRNGGKIIRFNFQIDRGTLNYIEEKISSFLDN